VLHHVGREDDRGAAARGFDDRFLEQRLVDRVEPGERLVEQQQARRVDQRGGELDLLRHALRELGHRGLHPVAELEPLEQRDRRLARGGGVHLLEAGEVDHGVEHLHRAVEPALLGQEADRVRVGAARRAAEDLDAAAARAQDVERHAQRGGLAGAVAAEEAEDAAFGDREAELADRGELAEMLRDAVEGEDWPGHAYPLRGPPAAPRVAAFR
jgi:hypothetical protein